MSVTIIAKEIKAPNPPHDPGDYNFETFVNGSYRGNYGGVSSITPPQIAINGNTATVAYTRSMGAAPNIDVLEFDDNGTINRQSNTY